MAGARSRLVVPWLSANLQPSMPSSQHLQNIIESAIDFAVIVTDLQGIVTDWNTGAEHILGWHRNDMIGASAARFFTPEDVATGRLQDEMRIARTAGRATDERWHLRKDGTRFWASGELMPLRDEAGTHHGYVKILRDRTTQREAGKLLRDTEDRFKTLLDNVEAAFAIVQVQFDSDDRPVDYRFVEANPAFEREAGVDLRGRWVTEFAPDLEQFWFDTYGRVAWTGEPANFESYAKAFGRWFDVRATRVGNPADRQIAILFNDVTARKHTEERLLESEALARRNAERVQLALAAGAIVGTWLWVMPEDKFTVDEAFANAFGLDPSLGREGLSLEQIIDTVHPDDKAGLLSAIGEAIEHGGVYAHQYRVRRANGTYRWIEANGRVDLQEDGKAFSFPGVLLDVQERRAMQEERELNAAALRALNDTLEQRVAERTNELMRAEEQLRQAQKMEAVGQLTGGLAHDFNNLLASISGALQLMGKRLEKGQFNELERYIEIARGATQRASSLTHRLLAFSRRQTLDPKPTDPGALVEGMAEMVQRAAGPQIDMTVSAQAGLWSVLVDHHQLENALLNLCINARDAMPYGGKLLIEIGNTDIVETAADAWNVPPGRYVVIRVADTGTGMPPEVVERVFEPFFTTKPLGMGTGLGLSMVYGFAKQSGGLVRIHSKLGLGTSVSVYLPHHHERPEAPQAVPEQPSPHAKEGENVLIVDDEPAVRALMAEVLTELGYFILEASDGASALALLHTHARVDLLITDVGLPGGMNGRQVADAARVDRPDLPILFVTGYSEGALGEKLPEGMHIMTKPFDMGTLARRARELIQG